MDKKITGKRQIIFTAETAGTAAGIIKEFCEHQKKINKNNCKLCSFFDKENDNCEFSKSPDAWNTTQYIDITKF